MIALITKKGLLNFSSFYILEILRQKDLSFCFYLHAKSS